MRERRTALEFQDQIRKQRIKLIWEHNAQQPLSKRRQLEKSERVSIFNSGF